MEQIRQNYYGNLCTEMYEILHSEAPADELDFYLSYAEKGKKILEPLCGSGRFLVPFLERGFTISGIDLSEEMLAKLKQKAPMASVACRDILQYSSDRFFDYIFISSSSVSLFTDISVCRQLLGKMKSLLSPDGVFVFAVDTIANRCIDDTEYIPSVTVPLEDGTALTLKTKNYYEEKSQTQFSPGIYELCRNDKLLSQEFMDFQTHLYTFGEMEGYLKEAGFSTIKTYSSFQKEIAVDDQCEFFLFECRIS